MLMGLGGWGRGRSTGSASGPRAQTPELPVTGGSAGHWQLRLEKTRPAQQTRHQWPPAWPLLPVAPPTSPPAWVPCTGPSSNEPQSEAVRAEPKAKSSGAETGSRPGRASTLDTRHRARLAQPAGMIRTEVLLLGSRRAEGPQCKAAPPASLSSPPPAPHPPLQTFPLYLPRGCLLSLL